MKWALLFLFLAGCAMPSKTEEFCYPKIKARHGYYLGIVCHFQ